MTRTLRLVSILTSVCFFAFGAALRAADVSDYGSAAGSMLVPEGLSAEEVQRCIAEGAIGRGWNILSRDHEKVVVALEQEKWVSKITVIYSTKDVQFFSKSTRSGKPKLPENWLKFLKQDITIKLNTLALTKK